MYNDYKIDHTDSSFTDLNNNHIDNHSEKVLTHLEVYHVGIGTVIVYPLSSRL